MLELPPDDTRNQIPDPIQPDELKYWTAFHRIAGIGRVRYQALLNGFPHAR